VQRPRCAGAGTTTVSSVGGAKCVAGPSRGADRVADPHLAQPQSLPICPRDRTRGPDAAAVEHARSPVTFWSPAQPVADAQRAGEQPHVRDLLAGRAALDLEHRAGQRPSGSPSPPGSSVAIAGQLVARPAPVIAEPKNTGCTAPPGLRGEARRSRRTGRPSST
jgi:hypothetical protein